MCDDSELKMGDWFDLVADRFGMPRPPRISRASAHSAISPDLLSFMSESRRLDNTRMKREFGIRLRYPNVADGLAALRPLKGDSLAVTAHLKVASSGRTVEKLREE